MAKYDQEVVLGTTHPAKAAMRERIRQDVERHLAEGNEVVKVPFGRSSWREGRKRSPTFRKTASNNTAIARMKRGE